MQKDYESHLQRMQQEYEARCKRCGACCGLHEKDPCEYLEKSQDDKYFCLVYENRFGIHKTINGNEFKCVPFRRILSGSWTGSWQCGYKKQSIVNGQ